MKQPGVVVALAALATISKSVCYNIQYFDCNDVRKIKTYRMDETCMHKSERVPSLTSYTILQKKDTLRLSGFSCKIIKTTLTEYCGAYSHAKLAQPPEVEVAATISPESCFNLVNTQTYHTADNRRVKLELNTENIIHKNELGLIVVEDNKISCRGNNLG